MVHQINAIYKYKLFTRDTHNTSVTVQTRLKREVFCALFSQNPSVTARGAA